MKYMSINVIQGKYLMKGNPVLLEACFCCVCVYILCFDRRSNNFKRTRRTHKTQTQQDRKNNRKTSIIPLKQNRNTGHPALDPTANRCLSGSGWGKNVFLLFLLCLKVVIEAVCVVLLLNVFVLIVDAKA